MNPKPIIVLVIEGTYPWYRGGVSEWLAHYIQAFPDYQFHIIQIATDAYLEREFENALYKVPRQVRLFIRIQSPGYQTGESFQLERWFQHHREQIEPAFRSADIIHVVNTGFAGWLGMNMAREVDAPLILTEHALYRKEILTGATALECGFKIPDNNREKDSLATLFNQTAEQIYHYADKVISVSKCNIEDQRNMGAGNIHYIPNGVDPHWLQFGEKNYKYSAPVIGWIGRCARIKNPLKFFDVINAFGQNGYGDTRFIMMMCDADEPRLQQKVLKTASQFCNLELIINQSAEYKLAAMDALCITSRNESQPLVLFEALARRVLPVGWEVGDVTSKYGVVVPTGTPADLLVQKIMQLWDRRDSWKQEVEQRFEIVRSDHTWDKIFRQYRAIFNCYLQAAVINEN